MFYALISLRFSSHIHCNTGSLSMSYQRYCRRWNTECRRSMNSETAAFCCQFQTIDSHSRDYIWAFFATISRAFNTKPKGWGEQSSIPMLVEPLLAPIMDLFNHHQDPHVQVNVSGLSPLGTVLLQESINVFYLACYAVLCSLFHF